MNNGFCGVTAMRIWKDEEKKFKQLINILRDSMTKDKQMDVHTHDFVEIEYVLTGRGVQTINGKEYTVKRGDFIYLKKGDCHTYKTDAVMEVLNVVFYYSVFDEISDILQLYVGQGELSFPTIMHVQGADMLYVEDLLLKAEKEFDEERAGYYHILKSYLIILLIYLQRILCDPHLGNNYKMPAILEYIDHNFSHISVGEISEWFGYSANYFSKLFKRETGVSFTDYVNKKRLNKAIELLVSSDNTVDSICADVGFNDKKHFYELFRRYVGTTPGTIRRQKSSIL